VRILYLSPVPPSTERPDVLYHPRLLARRHDVTLVVLYRREGELARLHEMRSVLSRVEALRLSLADSAMSCAARAFSPWPLYLAYYFNRRLLAAIQGIAADVRPDLVHAYTLRMAPYAARLGAPAAVCNIQDVLTTRYAGYAKRRVSAGWPVDVEEWLKLRRCEPALWRQMTRIGVVSEEEAADARAVSPGIDPFIIRPGVDPDYFSPFPDHERTASLVFLGRFGYRVNVEAAVRAARHVFPRVRQRVPGATLVLVGSDPPAAIRQLAAIPGVEVTGYVEDVRPFLGRAAVSLSPMVTGGGVKYKVLQSLAMATPVVTNERGARGTGLVSGRDLVVEESDEGMADACVALLSDPSRRRCLGESGRAIVVARHGWDAIADALEAFHSLPAPGWARENGAR
jgi:glycosyltransferase involved in cell wall biosynthesis